jgi:hypothetical protein
MYTAITINAKKFLKPLIVMEDNEIILINTPARLKQIAEASIYKYPVFLIFFMFKMLFQTFRVYYDPMLNTPPVRSAVSGQC